LVYQASFLPPLGFSSADEKRFMAPMIGRIMTDEWSLSEAVAKLNDALREKDMSVAELFDAFDADSDGTINGPELHHGIKNMVGDVLSPAQISQIIKAFDVNDDHRIDVDELRTALSEEE
jgi:Ca2+-binding EF-hand superfamily protein